MIHAENVSAVLVTKGDHDLTEIYDSLEQAGIQDIVVWDNSKRDRNLSCYGRYAGIEEAKNEFIFHQDDDLIAPVSDLLSIYDPVDHIDSLVSVNRADEEWLLTGIGSIFHSSLADCFETYIDLYGFGPDFCRVSDVVFAYQQDYRRVVLPYRDLAWAATPDRMHHEPDHYQVRMRALMRTLSLPYSVRTSF